MSPAVGGVLTPNIPYFGGTDNPGDNTAVASSYDAVKASETGPLSGPNVTPRFVAAPAGPLTPQTDTVLPAGVQAVPLTASGLEAATGVGPLGAEGAEGGVQWDPATGTWRESGQDEVAGAEATTPDQAPAAFPEPTP